MTCSTNESCSIGYDIILNILIIQYGIYPWIIKKASGHLEKKGVGLR